MLTKDQKRLIKAIKKGKSIAEACRNLKIPRQNHYYWKLTCKDYIDAIEASNEETKV